MFESQITDLARIVRAASLLTWATTSLLFLWGVILSLFPRRAPLPQTLAPISILKPLKGTDPGLEANLESFFLLEYPNYELLFSVEDPLDPALNILRPLIAKYPKLPARVFVADKAVEPKVGANPKVNNMHRAYLEALHDLVLISDSNVRVPANDLLEQVRALGAGVGMVSAVVCGSEAQGLGGQLEAVYLNTFYARWMRVTAWAGKTCVVGKSMLFRRSEAKRFGGLAILGRYLAEDYMAGEAMRHLGWRVVLAATPVKQIVGRLKFSQFWQRHLRWGRIRKAQNPLAFGGELLLGALASAACGGLAFGSVRLFAIHIFLWFFGDLVVMIKLQSGIRWRELPAVTLAWILRELLAPILWLHTALGSTVLWRGNQLKVVSGGLLESNEAGSKYTLSVGGSHEQPSSGRRQHPQ